VTERELTRRQRQIMDALIGLGEGTVAEIVDRIEDPPSYNTVRKILSILEDLGQVVHSTSGRKFVFRPKRSAELLGSQALRKVVGMFFGGSIERAVATYFSDSKIKLTDQQIAELRAIIENAKSRTKRENK
jgi:BlaI family transcriptional regulator, penicillinase repressor